MLIKLYKIIGQKIYKRHLTPEYPEIICQSYKCSEGMVHNRNSYVCLGCDIANDPVEKLYEDSSTCGWDTKFCYTYDNKESSNNRG